MAGIGGQYHRNMHRPRTTIIDPTKYKYPYLLRGLRIDKPNQVWAIDISYIPMPKGFMYLVVIIDLYSRYIVGWSLSNTIESRMGQREKREERSGKAEQQRDSSDFGYC